MSNLDGRLQGMVLLVDDNPVNQRVTGASLQWLGLGVEVAENGAQALERVQQGQFDLVLMDCQMPVMDGFEATAHIRRLPRAAGARLPIVALTGNALPGDAQRCLDAGMDAFLAKPHTTAELRDVLARWLAPAAPVATAPSPPVAGMERAHATPSAINLAVLHTLRELDLSGGTGLAREVFAEFLASARSGLAAVLAAIGSDDAKALGRAAHGLKSSAANVGAESLSACYRELEALAREGRMAAVRGEMERVRMEHERAVVQLQELHDDMQKENQ